MTVKEFALPDLGEGLTESEVVAWRVAVGDEVELNQIIAEVETAKALVEVPSPFAGVVRELHAEPGETLEVGAPLMSVEVESEAESATEGDEPADEDAREPSSAESRLAEPVAVGAQSSAARPVVKNEGGRPKVTGAAATAQASAYGAAEVVEVVDGSSAARADASTGDADALAVDDPAVEEPAVDEQAVERPADEERHAVLVGRGPRAQSARRPQRRARSGRLAEPVSWQRPDGIGRPASVAQGEERPATARDEMAADAGHETRSPVTGVRRRTAEAMVRSAAVPQVTEFLTVDVTRSIRLLDRLAQSPDFRGKRVTVLTLAAKALCLALAATPEANAHWDDATGEIVAPADVNLGIAVASRRGLVVPNIPNAAALRMPELADAIAELVQRARDGRSAPAEFLGGTVTITNVGVFGVDAGTPLLNPGETAILALGAVCLRPWEHKGRVRLRQVMTLSLTFDHRVIDGEQGSRLLRDLGRILADPATTLALA
jgi:pyruvate dehydrogenase E2 component (dihydrolipoamide acetyltransferase)